MCVSSGPRPINCRARQCRVARVTGSDSGLSAKSPWHSEIILFVGSNYTEVSQLALEDSGAFQDQSRGEGVLYFADTLVMAAEYESTNEYHVLDSTFARNQASLGAAIGWFSTKATLVVQRCFFEVGHSPALYLAHACHDFVYRVDFFLLAIWMFCGRFVEQRGDGEWWCHLHSRRDHLPYFGQCLPRQRRSACILGKHRLVRRARLHWVNGGRQYAGLDVVCRRWARVRPVTS